MAYQDIAGVSVGTVSADEIGVGTSDPNYEIEVKASNARIAATSDGGVVNHLQSNSTTGFVGTHTNHPLALKTNGTERVRIDSSGRVGISNSSPSSFHGNADDLVVGDGSGGRGVTIASGVASSGSLFFADGTAGDAAYRGQIQYAHGSDTMYFATAGASAWSINSSGNFVAATGKGIDFGSTTTGTGTVATNGGLLADYEFGYFTVTAGGTWTVTPTSMAGRYVKVGNLVTCWVTFGGSPSKTSATSGWLEGLPFATNVYNGQGSVSDTSVADRGNCYAANVNRLWLTGTSFGANNYATVTYRHD
jgi:hypothetical protein